MHIKAKIITSASAILLCGSLFAQDVYTVKNMSLKQALEKISKESKLAYIVDESLISGKTAPNIENVQGLKNALNQVLNGSGLEATIEKGTIIIEKIVGQGTVLETISVNEGYSNGSAQNGYVTKEISGVGLWDKRSLQDTPYQMSVISQDMIENTASGIAQIFKMNPVVQLSYLSTSAQSWNSSGMNIRGFSAVNNTIFDGIPLSGTYTALSQDLERVEILNGLSGFLYGVGYVGGAVNYITKKPTLERLTNITVGTTGNEAAYVHADLGGKIDEKGKFTYRLNAFKQEGETSIKDQKVDNSLVSGALDWRATDNLILSFDASHKKTVKGLTLTGGAYYTGESYRDGANTDVIPSYTVYDGGLRYKTKLDKYPTTFIMNVTNLTDKKYWRSSTSFGEPRNLAFSMKMEF